MSKKAVIVLCVMGLVGCGGSGGSSEMMGNDTTGQTTDTANKIIVAGPVAEIESSVMADKGAVVTFRGVEINGFEPSEYQWRLLSSPAESVPYFEGDGDTARIVNTDPGDYSVELIIKSGVIVSDPVIATTTVIDNGPAPTRDFIGIERDILAGFLVDHVRGRARFPDTFRVVGDVLVFRFTLTGELNRGAVTFDFSAQNGLGVPVPGEAVCPLEWDTEAGQWLPVAIDGASFCILD